LEDRMFRLREKLAEGEPDSAAKLAKALERLGEAEVDAKVERLIELLADDARLFRAGTLQEELLDDLESVLGVLLLRSDPDARRQRMELLEQYRQEVGDVLEAERALRSEAAHAAATARRAQQIADALRRIDRLIGEEAAVAEASQAAPGEDPTRLPADEQQRLAGEARQLGEDVRAIDEGNTAAGPDDAGQEAQPGAGQATAEASEAIESAAERMDDAAAALGRDDAAAAAGDQEEALEHLDRARHRLQQEAQRLAEQDEGSASASAADRQRDLAGRTGDLANRMSGGQRGGGRQQPGDQEGGRGAQGEPAPGQQNVEQARQNMEDAAEDLDRERPQEAARDQDWAVEELEEAIEKLQDELQQLRREERQELLSDLESRFVEMLNRQLAVNADTVAIFERSGGGLARADRLRVAQLAEEQEDLADAAATCLHILEEDGTTIVFPRVMGQLGDDMTTVARRLLGLRLGALTQSLQREIATTLSELIDAVRRLQQSEEQRQQQGQPGEPSEEAPLLPGSAELKLLKAAQLRINRRTGATQEARSAGTEPAEDIARLLGELEYRQRKVAGMAREMRDQSE
ncbi:MAG: coiled-coil domain-containing protein, partial [Planctomycetota bacterium]